MATLPPTRRRRTRTRRRDERSVADRLAAGDVLLSYKAAAEKLGKTPRFPRRLCEENRIPYVKVGRENRIWLSDLAAYIEENTVGTVAE